MKIELKELPLLGKENPPYIQRRMTEEEMKREDISPDKLYLVRYDKIWLIGRFSMCWYGWHFEPNLGSMCPQINDLSAIYEMDLPQDVDGSTAGYIMSYLPKEDEEEDYCSS